MTLPGGSYVGNILVAPSINLVPAFGPGWPAGFTTDQELQSSTARFTQTGVTLAGGQGILPIGTVLGRNSATKLYHPYSSAASDGTQIPRGILRTSVDTNTQAAVGANIQANMVVSGILKNSLVSGADGTAVTDLVARVDTVLDTFTF
jgi:hypothetical protein